MSSNQTFYLTRAALAPPLSAGCLPKVSSSPRFSWLSCESRIPQISAALPCPGRLQGQTAAGDERNEAALIPPVNLCLLPATTRAREKWPRVLHSLVYGFVLYPCFLQPRIIKQGIHLKYICHQKLPNNLIILPLMRLWALLEFRHS